MKIGNTDIGMRTILRIMRAGFIALLILDVSVWLAACVATSHPYSGLGQGATFGGLLLLFLTFGGSISGIVATTNQIDKG